MGEIKDFDVMGDFLVDNTIDHDIFVSRPKPKELKVEERKLKEMDVPEVQKQIISI